MKPVERSEVLSIGDYEAIRAQFRARIIEEKRHRRFSLGDRAFGVFENHDTALLQIQEMLRTERITREGAILHEIETYNELVPGDRELSCTILVTVDDKEERDRFLAQLQGVERTIAITVDGRRFPATWDEQRTEPDRASAVLYLKFPLDAEATNALRSGKAQAATISVDHPVYRAEATLDRSLLASLAEDFR